MCIRDRIGPVAYFRNGTGNPLVNYSELSARWGISRSSVGRLLKKLADFDYLSPLTFPGRSGTVIYLKNYLSTMFRISDVMIDKEEVAMCLNLRVSVPDTIPPESGPISDEQISVSTGLSKRCIRDRLIIVLCVNPTGLFGEKVTDKV